MAAADLSSAHDLANRAQQQFDALKSKADAFREQHSWGTDVVRHEDGWVMRARIDEQPPEGWWLDLGELAANARSALDHLVFQLALDSGNDPREQRTQFPIFEVEDDYLKGGKRNWRERMLAGVASRHRKVIDDYQPYKVGGDAAQHPLAVLRSLTDRHKHRERHVGAALLESFTARVLFTDGTGLGFRMGQVQNVEPVLDKHHIQGIKPAQQTEVEVPGIGTAKVLVPSGMDPDPGTKLTIGFFGDRAFRIEQIAAIPPYVSEIVSRVERRIESKRPGTRATRCPTDTSPTASPSPSQPGSI